MRACLRRNLPGPYQIQAAINAVHSDAPTAARDRLAPDRRSSTTSCWRAPPTAGRRAQPRGRRSPRSTGPAAALAVVDGLDLDDYHLFHATRADLLARLGGSPEAAAAYDRAIELTANAAERAFLEGRAPPCRRDTSGRRRPSLVGTRPPASDVVLGGNDVGTVVVDVGDDPAEQHERGDRDDRHEEVPPSASDEGDVPHRVEDDRGSETPQRPRCQPDPTGGLPLASRRRRPRPRSTAGDRTG